MAQSFPPPHSFSAPRPKLGPGPGPAWAASDPGCFLWPGDGRPKGKGEGLRRAERRKAQAWEKGV